MGRDSSLFLLLFKIINKGIYYWKIAYLIGHPHK